MAGYHKKCGSVCALVSLSWLIVYTVRANCCSSAVTGGVLGAGSVRLRQRDPG